MSVFYLIPWKNNSERLPYKNHLLLDYTLDYLRAEKVDFTNVFTFGKDSPNLKTIKHIQLPDEADTCHKSAVANTLIRLQPKPHDIIVQLQITQPLRRAGLVSDAVSLARESDKSVISYTAVDCTGRVLHANGVIWEGCQHRKTPLILHLYDGAIYAGSVANWQDWFDMSKPHETVKNQDFSVCDIDTIEDLKKHIRFQ